MYGLVVGAHSAVGYGDRPGGVLWVRRLTGIKADAGNCHVLKKVDRVLFFLVVVFISFIKIIRHVIRFSILE
jgi:hypothetical protein